MRSSIKHENAAGIFIRKSQVERMLTGSVSTFVVAHSPVSTLVVKP
ncbi:hypothetical protein ASZ90_016624 [hydrocarbon metagenome]|uniref:Uncharacterized protein n=1 Tax=hydrocarbon metagenome TaxID=938273 RepID=A0A0W8ELF3_9ZZZZ